MVVIIYGVDATKLWWSLVENEGSKYGILAMDNKIKSLPFGNGCSKICDWP